MHYRLYGLGRNLRRELVDATDGSLGEALALARAMLGREHDCETVEIFSDVRFLTAVDRSVAPVPAESASWR